MVGVFRRRAFRRIGVIPGSQKELPGSGAGAAVSAGSASDGYSTRLAPAGAPLLLALGGVLSGGATGAIDAMGSSISDTWGNRIELFAVGAGFFGGLPVLVGVAVLVRRRMESRRP